MKGRRWRPRTEGGTPPTTTPILRGVHVLPLIKAQDNWLAGMDYAIRCLATGERRLNFTSEAQEIAMGKQAVGALTLMAPSVRIQDKHSPLIQMTVVTAARISRSLSTLIH